MATTTSTPPTKRENPFTWGRISKRLVPVFAVITALVLTVPLMMATGARGSITRGLQIAGRAYAGMLEGSLGLAVNDQMSADNLRLALQLAEATPIEVGDAGTVARRISDIRETGLDTMLAYGAALENIDLEQEQLEELAGRIGDIQNVGVDTLTAMEPLITELNDADRGEVRTLAEAYRAIPDELTAEARADIEAYAPSAADYEDADLMAYMQIINNEGVVSLFRALGALEQLNDMGIDPTGDDATILAALAEFGVQDVERAYPIAQTLQEAGVTDLEQLEAQLRQIDEMDQQDLFTESDLATAITEELPKIDILLVRRPGNRVFVAGTGFAGITYDDQNTPDDPTDDEPETLWMRLGGSALLFLPRELEGMIIRSIPFVIAGLAVALGFKAGLFNIGAEGQLYIGAIFAVFVGYSTLFAGLPMLVHLPLVIVVGIIGGLLWGAIPGALKAYTGAHEVITTIMLNFIAVRLVDWLINTPELMRNPEASIPQTPVIADSAQLPRFDDMPLWMLISFGVIYAAVAIYLRREQIQQNIQAAISPILNGILVVLVGIFLSWITVRENLHVGLLLMIFAVWFTDWFLNRTTLGFELRTVGSNPNAAKYAGMSVPRNLVLAMALSGALAGLAGVIEMSGVQYNMQPNFFSGLGFDAIAVALLARTNPRNMIWAGLLWGGLYAGAPLMQTRAEISIDLVSIIQALIIMFIAADAIIRYLWRVPDATPEEKAQQMFSTGWGG